MEGSAMKRIAILTFCFLTALCAWAQETDNLESLTIPPEEVKTPVAQKTDAELSLPASTASSSVVKSNLGDAKKQKEKDNVGAILDFEGEVIEGERRRPDLFLQISIDNIKFDSLIYNRDDFNDYLEVDRKSRTRFLKMK
jgi:hypothetical protein